MLWVTCEMDAMSHGCQMNATSHGCQIDAVSQCCQIDAMSCYCGTEDLCSNGSATGDCSMGGVALDDLWPFCRVFVRRWPMKRSSRSIQKSLPSETRTSTIIGILLGSLTRTWWPGWSQSSWWVWHCRTNIHTHQALALSYLHHALHVLGTGAAGECDGDLPPSRGKVFAGLLHGQGPRSVMAT